MVCLGAMGGSGAERQLDALCIMLWDMARYHNYDIRSPYNRDAALWVANQTSILFPTDSRPLRDLRVAQGRVEASNENSKGKSNGSAGDSSGRSTCAGRAVPERIGDLLDSRSPVDRVRQFMERYARAIGAGMCRSRNRAP